METKKFNIFGEPWKINWVTCITNPDNPEQWRWGETNTGAHLVRISKETIEGKKIPQRTQDLTKYHELIHVILEEGQYLEESNNEPLVEWLAKCLKSLKEQNLL